MARKGCQSKSTYCELQLTGFLDKNDPWGFNWVLMSLLLYMFAPFFLDVINFKDFFSFSLLSD